MAHVEKYSKILIGIINDNNINTIHDISFDKNIKVVLFSNVDIFKLKNYNFDNIYFIPNKKNITQTNQYKKMPEHTLYVDWLLKQPKELTLEMNNNSLVHLGFHNEPWHIGYKGLQGYAISPNQGNRDIKYGYSSIIAESREKLLIKQFDGIFLKDYQ